MAVICFVSYEIHPTTAGGCGVLISHAAARLVREGHDVVLLLDVGDSLFRRFLDQDRALIGPAERIRAYRVDDLCAGFPYRANDVTCIFQWKSLRFSYALRALSARESIDFVEFFEYCGPGYYAFVERLFALEAGERPVLGSRVHGSIEVLDRYGDGRVRDTEHFLQHSFERGALALSEATLVPSMTYYDRYYRTMYDLEPERVEVSPPPKQPFPKVSRRPSTSEVFSIAFVGRMFHLKGVDQLVHAAVMLMKRRPELNCRVDLIGYDSNDGPLGSYVAFLQTLIPPRLRERFHFLGHMKHGEIAERLNDALFAVFPNRVESFCYALHEVHDAGVPIIANRLPAFEDFFRHEQTALLYDGTTGGLVASMERLIDEDGLRDRLASSTLDQVAPLGTFYERPRAMSPLAGTHEEADSTLVVVLNGGDEGTDSRAVRALKAQTCKRWTGVVLAPAHPEAEETLWWLGRPWSVRGVDGQPLEPSDIFSSSSVAILTADDAPAPQWLERCRLALARRPKGAFAGTWRISEGRVRPSVADIAPELLAMPGAELLPRAVIRTDAGMLLSDLLDPSLESLGVVGLAWRAIARGGLGVMLPEPLMEAPDGAGPLATPSEDARRGLLLRYAAPFGDRLAVLAGMAHEVATATPTAPPPSFTTERKVELADELGGRLLARLAWKKLTRRVLRHEQE